MGNTQHRLGNTDLLNAAQGKFLDICFIKKPGVVPVQNNFE
jgi:hypothetical protein